ncbi:MAG: hypothetical protein HS120_05685 [Burkholderiales bacterium]|nr:hypothetical protein [Burkholderiales bacterium]
MSQSRFDGSAVAQPDGHQPSSWGYGSFLSGTPGLILVYKINWSFRSMVAVAQLVESGL